MHFPLLSLTLTSVFLCTRRRVGAVLAVADLVVNAVWCWTWCCRFVRCARSIFSLSNLSSLLPSSDRQGSHSQVDYALVLVLKCTEWTRKTSISNYLTAQVQNLLDLCEVVSLSFSFRTIWTSLKVSLKLEFRLQVSIKNCSKYFYLDPPVSF